MMPPYTYSFQGVAGNSRQAAFELFETFWPEDHAVWEKSQVPGLHFDSRDFMDSFTTLQIQVGEAWYLVVDTD